MSAQSQFQHGQQAGVSLGNPFNSSSISQAVRPPATAPLASGNSFASAYVNTAKKPAYVVEEPPRSSRRDRSDKVPVRQLVSRLMWAHGDVSQPSSDTVDTMMDIVHDYIFDIMTPPSLTKPSPPNYAPQSQRFQAVTPSILHRRLQVPHHRKKLASLKEVVSRQKVEKQKKKTSTTKIGKPSTSAPGLGGLGIGLDDLDFLNM